MTNRNALNLFKFSLSLFLLLLLLMYKVIFQGSFLEVMINEFINFPLYLSRLLCFKFLIVILFFLSLCSLDLACQSVLEINDV